MKGISTWSYAPYKPILFDFGDIYVCRIVPSKNSIHIEWLPAGEEYELYIKERGAGSFSRVASTGACEFDFSYLETEKDYEFYVLSGKKRSRIRLARTGEYVGRVVNYLHPDDNAYEFSGKYLCSPSLLKHPDGYLLASMDLYASEHPQNLNMIFRSDDGGESWYYVSELMPSFWGQLFYHEGSVYMLSVSTEYGDLLIGRSDDGGKTFSPPVTLLKGTNGKHRDIGVHKNPQNMLIHNGRLWFTLEYGSWGNKEFCHAAMIASIAIDDDLLIPENWSFSEPRVFDNFTEELADLPKNTMTIEGTPVISPKCELLNVMRFGKRGKALAYLANENDPEAMLEYHSLIDLNANFSKFMIRYDEVSRKYYTVATTLYEGCKNSARNYLTLMASSDLKSFDIVRELIDKREEDVDKVGFQYAYFDFDGEDIIFLLRTAICGADSYHDSNCITFHRIKNFRSL